MTYKKLMPQKLNSLAPLVGGLEHREEEGWGREIEGRIKEGGRKRTKHEKRGPKFGIHSFVYIKALLQWLIKKYLSDR